MVSAAQPRMLALSRELEAHRDRLEGQAPNPGARIFASTLLVAGLVAIGPGCGGAVEAGDSPGEREPAGGSASSTKGGIGGGGQTGGTVTASGGAITTTSVAALGGSASGGATSRPSTSSGGAINVPNHLSTSCERMTLRAISRNLDTLTRPICSFPPHDCQEYQLRIDASGQVVDLLPWSSMGVPITTPSAEVDAARDCVIQVLSQERYPCLTDGFAWSHSDCLLIL